MALGRGVICLAVYRPDLDLLRIQIDSIRAQTHEAWTCLIGIDGRDDGVAHTVNELVADDARFTISNFTQNVGFYRNFERLLASVSDDAQWVALADQDDRWFPDKLETLARPLAEFPDTCSAVVGQARVVDIHGVVSDTTHRRYTGPVDLVLNNMVTGSFALFSLETVRTALPFPEPTDVAYHDHWLGLCAAMTGSITVMSTPLQDYVQHGANVVGEAKATPILRRWRRIGPMRETSQRRLAYIRDHRWGWRVRMTRLALGRCSNRNILSKRTMRDLGLIATGGPSARLALLVVRSVARGATPPSRGGSHLVGMLMTTRKHV